jgi:DHA2 family multidrug resistance protein
MTSSDGVATRVVATAGLVLATLMIMLDTTIANVALPHVQGSLSASQDQITWVLTSYVVATAMTSPLTSWLSQQLGRKRLFLISITAFVGVSVLCGLATSLPELVLLRLLQGFSGAAMMPLSQAAIFDLWPPQTVPRVMAVWSSVMTVAPILGPTLGGWLTETYSWRWCFYINLPVGALAFAAVYAAWRSETEAPARPFDGLGFGALILFTVGAQLMADRGPGQDWFDSPEIRFEALLAACGGYVFVMQMLTSRNPFVHRDILTDRNFMSCLAVNLVMNVTMYATSALLPTMMQNLLGYSALQSGIASAPRGLGSVAALAIVPWLAARFGSRRVIGVGAVLTACALWQMGHFDLSMTSRSIATTGFLQGFGNGLMFNPLVVLMFATLAPEHRTEAAVFSNTLRTLAGSLGIAGMQAMLIRRSATAHEQLAAHIVPSDPTIRWSLPHAFDGAAGALQALNAEVTRQAAMIGYDAAFGLMSLATLMLLPLLLVMRSGKSRSTELLEVVHAE